MCLEFLRRFITRHETIWCPSKTIEDGVYLRFFSVDLSHRKAVLLRGVRFGKVWVESSRTRLLLLHHLSFGTLEHPPFLSSMQLVLVAELAVVLLPGAVVPQALAVVPCPCAVVLQEPTVVALPQSCSTVAPRPSTAALR